MGEELAAARRWDEVEGEEVMERNSNGREADV
jgi:hypothetical protein